jgi:hypothetical protein
LSPPVIDLLRSTSDPNSVGAPKFKKHEVI